jgi:hypothetical protein
MSGACSTNVEKRNSYRLLAGKPEGKRPLGRPIRRWVASIKMDLGETAGGIDSRLCKWRAFVNVVLNLWVP